ncbi:DUF4132 domain-containing protein [Actinoplanes subglobosus]|uniref:DUF4132 domain-containing protein n=1 Tax=Actinoplanes subglobosus TaxID=1547892 RepID=A0ABV8J4U2_9ACTN
MGAEDMLVLPDNWLGFVHPRRGGGVVRPFSPDPEARALSERMPTERRGGPAGVLGAATTPEAIRAAAAGSSVLGAAAVAAIRAEARSHGWDDRARLADVWIAEQGLPFAAEAAVEMTSLVIIDDDIPPSRWHWRYSSPDAGIRHLRPGETQERRWAGLPVLLRVREAIAAAPEEEFERVVAALAPYRGGHAYARAACSVLLSRPDWLDDDVAATVADRDGCRARMLLHAVRTAQQAHALALVADPWHLGVDRGLVLTLLDGVGAPVAPTFFYWLDQKYAQYSDAGTERWLFSAVARIPGDDVMGWLLSRADSRIARSALLEAVERFPARALRILAEQDVADLLRMHLHNHPGLVDQVMPLLSAEAGGRVRAIVAAWSQVVTAPPSRVPPVLATPPWQSRGKAAKPVVVPGLTCTDPAVMTWRPGERQEWAASDVSFPTDPASWEEIADRVVRGAARWNEPGHLFTRGPEEIARPALAQWPPRTDYDSLYWIPVVVTRFGTDMLPPLLRIAREAPADYGQLLMPFESPEVATLMADWSVRLKTVRRLAQRWLLRHPAASARALIPAALGKAGTTRRQAERALLLLHGKGHAEQVRAAAAGYGPEAAAGVEALLTADPLLALPARMPSPPVWAVPGALPPVRLRDGSGTLPAEAVTNLILMLMISRSDEPYAGLDVVRQAVEERDLAELGWALFELWQTAGASAKEGWVLDAVALTGGDEIADRITPLILVWPTQGMPARAITGLSVLAGIGTDGALMHIHRISQRAKSTPLRKAAAARIGEVAESLGLTADQLADRLVPDFGLAADGSLRLDYGPRQFVVGFDEQLRPFVTDGVGKRLKALPKPGARDDAELGEAAYQRFSSLKRAVRKIATEQVRRLEQAMIAGRRWSGAEFRRLFAEHPLMWHIGRRLVWVRLDEAGAVVGGLRIAEDRSFASLDDEPVLIGDDDVLGVAHPVQLGDDAAGWAEVFADYEILQPFPQLGRPVFALTEAERPAGSLKRFEGVTVPTTKVLTLDRRGWRRHEPVNAGIQTGFDRPAGPGQVVTVHLDPGIVGQVGFHAEQKLVDVYLHDGSTGPWEISEGRLLPLGDLDPVMASEILRDLTDVTS